MEVVLITLRFKVVVLWFCCFFLINACALCGTFVDNFAKH